MRELDALPLADPTAAAARAADKRFLSCVWRRSGTSLRSATRILESVFALGPGSARRQADYCRHMRTTPFSAFGLSSTRGSSVREAQLGTTRVGRCRWRTRLGVLWGERRGDHASCVQSVRWRRSSTSVASCPPDTVTCRAVHCRAHRRTPSRRRARTAPAREREALQRADRPATRSLAGDGQGLLLRPGGGEGQGGQGTVSRLVPAMRRANPGPQREGRPTNTARTAIPERSPAAGPASR